MAKKTDKKAERLRRLFNRTNTSHRTKWEKVNQQGYDFANDNQMTAKELKALEEQGMPTFTINRITPVVEMLNFYGTANTPRWQAIGAEGSDADVAAVFSDMADYIWYNSDGPAVYGNVINDAITKSIGYMLVTVDKDADNGMGEVIIEQPDPFDIFVDPKSRDLLFRDAAYVMVRKVLPRSHIVSLFPEHKRKIMQASANESQDYAYTEKVVETGKQRDFHYKDITASESIDPSTGEQDVFLELFELWEKKKISYVNVFYQEQPTKQQMEAINQQVEVQIEELRAEKEVAMQEQQMQLDQAVQSGQMIPARYELEVKKMQEATQQEIEMAQQQMLSDLVGQISQIQTKVVTKKEYDILTDDADFAAMVVDAVSFHKDKIFQTCVVGDKTIYETELPENITRYPLIPFHFKWTGTPYPTSAVAPLVGKQRELNKAHQIMVHNASLGSSLRFMHEEGSIDTDHWERYSSSPGALLPIRPGATPPTPVMPAPLASAFYQIVQEGKGDMEYLAGIYSSMQGDVSGQHDTYRGMLAQDEYGTRRVKQWMKNVIEPGLKQVGLVVMEYSQAVYTAHKVFRIVQPNALQEQREVEINVPMYNDLGEAIGKYHDYGAAKFDVRVVAGSTLPVNRWAYLAELKELLQFGVVDDLAVLAETDLRNKEQIAKRKSLYAQLSGQVEQLSEAIKDKDGTIETLERQLVQAGIKGKVMAAEMEISKQKSEVKADTKDAYRDTVAKQKVLQANMAAKAETENTKLGLGVQQAIKNAELNAKKDLQGNNKS